MLRYDERGIGESEGPALSWLDARPLLADAAAATRLLAGLPGVDPDRVTLIGHRQGGDLALAAARRRAGRATRTLTLPGTGHFVSVDGRVAEGALDAIARFARAA